VSFYLIQAQLSAKRYSDAVALARQARVDQPDDLRLARLEAEGLRLWGKPDDAVSVLEQLAKRQAANPMAHVALAQIYQDTNRGPQAVKVLQDARTKFPTDTSITFELGAILEKQKKYADAETAFRQVLAQEPEHGPALNYLGYMLAERGERLAESLDLIKRALETEPDNGSYLDSLGWAYYKDGKFDLAEQHLKRAADQLQTNSVVQDHYGDVLFRLGRFDDAIAAWSRALSGDREDVDQGGIDRKIRSANRSCHADDPASRGADDRRCVGGPCGLVLRHAADEASRRSGAPASDTPEAFAATSACRAVSSMTADASVSGSAGGRRLRADWSCPVSGLCTPEISGRPRAAVRLRRAAMPRRSS
jgi:tetratricopeptide (TPR) repeat protein